MKNKNKFLMVTVTMLFLFFSDSLVGQAVSEKKTYIPLEPLPAIGQTKGIDSYKEGDLSTYMQWIFAFGISTAGILAVLMIIWGGVQYLTAYGNPGQTKNARDRISQALIGLGIAITAWLILYTINPDLVRTGLVISSPFN